MRSLPLLSLVLLALALVSVHASTGHELVADSSTPNANAKIFVERATVSFLQTIINSALQKALANLPLDDMSVSIWPGHVNLSGIILKNVLFAENEVVFNARDQITINIVQMTGKLVFKWEYKGILGIHFGGTGSVSFSQTNIDTTFQFTSDKTGKPVITMKSLKVKIKHLDISLSGGGGKFWEFLINIFKGLIIPIVEKQISSTATKEFNTLIASITKYYPTAIPLSPLGDLFNNVTLNTPLVVPGQSTDTPFLMQDNFMVMSSQFWFSSDLNSTIDQHFYGLIPNFPPNNTAGLPPMVGFQIDDYVLGSLMFTLTQNGVFDFYITNENIPPSAGIQLTTALFALDWPALASMYPNMNLTVDVSQYLQIGPQGSTSVDGSYFNDSMVVVISVVDPSQPTKPIPVAQLSVVGNLTAQFRLYDNSTGLYLGGKIGRWYNDVTVTWSVIPPQNLATGLNSLAQLLVNNVLLAMINEFMLKPGLKIGEASFGIFPLSNAFLSYQNGYLAIGIDINMPGNKEEALEAYLEFTKEEREMVVVEELVEM